MNALAVKPNAATHSLSKKKKTTAPVKTKTVKKTAPVKTKTVKKAAPGHDVVFAIKYTRNTESAERDPTPKELERYVAKSPYIPENPGYLEVYPILEPVTYIGDLKFHFTTGSTLSPEEIANEFLQQSLGDGEWEAPPGGGSFVYPTKALNEGMPDVLGLLSFAYVVVDGKKFMGQ
jgi:hypothetical protein